MQHIVDARYYSAGISSHHQMSNESKSEWDLSACSLEQRTLASKVSAILDFALVAIRGKSNRILGSWLIFTIVLMLLSKNAS